MLPGNRERGKWNMEKSFLIANLRWRMDDTGGGGGSVIGVSPKKSPRNEPRGLLRNKILER